jgi:hypothetical protein
VSETAATLQLARDLLSRADPSTAGLWPRAAALLIRQALEEAVDAYWRARQLPLDSLPTHAQLVCLRMMASDGAPPAHLHEAWGALSRACHHHPYELAPTAAELAAWIEVVERFAASSASPKASAVDGAD